MTSKLIQARPKDIKDIKLMLLKKQDYKCKICGDDMKDMESRDICVDHQHFGDKLIRAVLCRRCNACEGKLYNSYIRSTLKSRRCEDDYLRMLKGLAKYPKLKRTNYIHPLAIKKRRKVKRKSK